MSTEELINEENNNHNKPMNSNVKLPYFHRTLSNEDQMLIGDITPKRIDDSNSNSNPNANSNVNSNGSSAWNTASTWEDKDKTLWAKKVLNDLFINTMNNSILDNFINCKKNELSISFDSIKSISGHANITYSRGKARYLYEFSMSLVLCVTDLKSSIEYKNIILTINDAINDLLEDMELSLELPAKDKDDNSWKAVPTNIHQVLKSLVDTSFKQFCVNKFREFEKQFQET